VPDSASLVKKKIMNPRDFSIEYDLFLEIFFFPFSSKLVRLVAAERAYLVGPNRTARSVKAFWAAFAGSGAYHIGFSQRSELV
jgi:hypothetical protein